LKIAINTRLLLPKGQPEGIGRYIYELTKRIVENHPEDEFYFFFDRQYNPEYIFAKNVTPIVIYPSARHAILFYLWYEWCIPYYLKKYNIDVFFSPDHFLSLSTNTKQVLTIHDLAFVHLPETIPFSSRKYYQYFMPKYVNKADHIIAVSDHTKNDILKNYTTVSENKISTIYNALPSSFQIKGEAKISEILDPYFVVVGSINPRKNTLRVLQAYVKASAYNDYKIVFIGKFMWDSEDQILNDLWKKLVNENKLIHIQNANDESMINYIRHSKALVYASLYEGFGFPILEGMACEVPVITSYNSSMSEVAGMNNALLVNPLNVEEIAEAMTKIINKNIEIPSLVANGLKRINDFSWDIAAEKLYTIFKKVHLQDKS
jgi:glycosyltransferase involved in cell wall biosynthesis